MRSSWLATAGVALACVPCILVLLIGAGIGTGALSAIGAELSQPSLAAVAAVLAVLLFAGAAMIFIWRRREAACETDLTPTSSDDGPRRSHKVAGSSSGEPRT